MFSWKANSLDKPDKKFLKTNYIYLALFSLERQFWLSKKKYFIPVRIAENQYRKRKENFVHNQNPTPVEMITLTNGISYGS